RRSVGPSHEAADSEPAVASELCESRADEPVGSGDHDGRIHHGRTLSPDLTKRHGSGARPRLLRSHDAPHVARGRSRAFFCPSRCVSSGRPDQPLASHDTIAARKTVQHRKQGEHHMYRFLPGPLLGLLLLMAITINTFVCFVPILFLAVIKFVIPNDRCRHWWTRPLVVVAEAWIHGNNFFQRLALPTRFEFRGLDDPRLRRDGRYLVASNHQTWTDVLLLQYLL